MIEEARDVARAMRDHVLHAVDVVPPRLRRGKVLQIDPLQIELLDTDELVADESEVFLSSWLRLYDRVYGIAVGDILFVWPVENGTWFALDVASRLDMLEGVAPFDALTVSADPAYSGVDSHGDSVTVVPSRHITHKLPYRDHTGAVVGYIPIFGSLA